LIDRPVIVLGVSRSGTTLLKEMLDSHSELAIPSESYFIPQLWDRHGGRFDAEEFLEDLARIARVREWGVTPEQARERLPESPSTADGIRAIYRSYADARGKPLYGDKTPSYMQCLDLLERVFPDARYVHLVRDGRDAALSFFEMRRRPRFNVARPRGLASFASHWRLEVEGARKLGSRLSTRYHELRYEDLVREPETELRRICDFLELEFEPAMLAYHEDVDSSVLQDHPLLAKPPTSDTRRWQEQLAAEDAELFEAIAGDTLSELGYERQYPHPSARAQARAALVDVGYRTRLASWKRSLKLVRRSPAWRLRQAYIRRTAGA
jgi:Sulfotransferase family